jgi:hypothetical protein
MSLGRVGVNLVPDAVARVVVGGCVPAATIGVQSAAAVHDARQGVRHSKCTLARQLVRHPKVGVRRVRCHLRAGRRISIQLWHASMSAVGVRTGRLGHAFVSKAPAVDIAPVSSRFSRLSG